MTTSTELDALEVLRSSSLDVIDPEVAELVRAELARQRTHVELVASENFTWPAALTALASAGANKLADGYPGQRATGGCEVIDELERLAIARAVQLFGADHANVQPHSGAQANMAVYFACLAPGDTFLAMRTDQGGHQTHGAQDNFSGRFYRPVWYGVNARTGRIDLDHVRALALEHRPRLIVAGASGHPRAIDARGFRAIADEVGAPLLFDMAHVAGLVAAGLHPDPVPHAEYVSSTVHKTLAGPRCGGFVLCRGVLAEQLDAAVSPGVQSAPFPQAIAAKAVAFGVAGTAAFRAFQQQVVANAGTLAQALLAHGIALETGGTDTHLLVVNVDGLGLGAAEAEALLHDVGITVNRWLVPNDPRAATGGSGLRLGSPAVTMRGFDGPAIEELGDVIAGALRRTAEPPRLRARTLALLEAHPLYTGWDGSWPWGGGA